MGKCEARLSEIARLSSRTWARGEPWGLGEDIADSPRIFLVNLTRRNNFLRKGAASDQSWERRAKNQFQVCHEIKDRFSNSPAFVSFRQAAVGPVYQNIQDRCYE